MKLMTTTKEMTVSLPYDPVYSFNLPPDNRKGTCPDCGGTTFAAEDFWCEGCAEAEMEAEGEAAYHAAHRNDGCTFQVVPARFGDPVDMG